MGPAKPTFDASGKNAESAESVICGGKAAVEVEPANAEPFCQSDAWTAEDSAARTKRRTSILGAEGVLEGEELELRHGRRCTRVFKQQRVANQCVHMLHDSPS